MKTPLPVYPFGAERRVGTIIEVGPSSAKANLPDAATASGRWLHGHRAASGEVGEFLFVEAAERAILARVLQVRLPERDRLTVDPKIGSSTDVHPVGVLQLLATISLGDGSITNGVATHPRLGAAVFAAHPTLLKWITESDAAGSPFLLDVATLPASPNAVVAFTPEKLFGRHCAVLGASGGGKSWTLARLVEEGAKGRAKILLVDATGEFHGLTGPHVRHHQIGTGDPFPSECSQVCFPYNELTEGDLFALFKPSGQTQGPKLRQAMRTLKLLRLAPNLAPNSGFYKKELKDKASYEQAYRQHSRTLEAPRAAFAIEHLAHQLSEECVFPTDRNDSRKWGAYADNERSYCLTLISRIEDMLHSPSLACILKPVGNVTFAATLDAFLRDPVARLLRISLKYLPFADDARGVVTNAIGRHLLAIAREGRFRGSPLLVVIDEAHQFLNRHIGDENTRYPLDSFELIAKEGRKYSLTVCFATQRPRDIPEGVLSQVGTMIVHRLTNERDREMVERASGDLDRSAASFLPTLGPGQAIVVGVDLAIPMTVDILPPNAKPDSRGPAFQEHCPTLTSRGSRKAHIWQ
jgi:hypothetical protein